ncbi:MAG: M15 family metallopeptidase [Bacteroidia bacterium]|nr:M15 family metallopeptidase [Bacteroidia bacterium]
MNIFKTGACITLYLFLAACGEPKNETQKPEQIQLTTGDTSNKEYKEPETHKIPSVPGPSSAKPSNSPASLPVVVSKEYLLGKFKFESHPDFIKVEKTHTNRYGEAYLRKEAYAAFVKMYDAALKDGVKLLIISATRDFERQKEIWNGKWKGKYAGVSGAANRASEILTYSSMPCTSRHHWGSDMDLNDLSNEHFEKGEGKKIYEWMLKHAHEYGFCQPYTPKGTERPYGYNEEKWHWSYMPLSKPFLAQYLQSVTLNDISGFEGSEVKTELDVIQHYVAGINKDCK